jgi:TIR domain
MGYEFDIFFSYKRNAYSSAWHTGLKDSLAHWVSEGLDGEAVRIFFDIEDINVGARWKSKIVSALCSSKCLVAVWSPEYFRSKYCVAEWLTFDKRSKLFNRELIAPASRADGQFFPIDARALQIAKFNDYALYATKFWETGYAAEFEIQLVKPFALDVAKLIRQAPDFAEDFPVVDIDMDLPATALLRDEIMIPRIATGR